MEVTPFVAKSPLGKAQPSVLAVYCSDHRFRKATIEFLESTHPNTGIDQFVLPGAIWWVARLSHLSNNAIRRVVLKNLSSVQNAVKLLIRKHHLSQVVLIGHQDCAYYKTVYPELSPADAIRAQGKDLVLARDALAEWSGRETLTVSGYIATFDDAGVVTFQPGM